MAAGGISSGKQRNPRGFMTVLSSAVCEWFLMFLLFLDAALAYFIAKFASYYELQTPCMLCSRFNHILGDKKSGCYGSHLCRNHKEDVSFQVFCHIHGNLADVRAMCEECLVSFATENILIKESDNLMIDKLGNKSFIPSSPGPWNCSCCQKTWRARSSAQRLLQLTSVGFGASKANVKPPLPRAPGRSRFSRRDSFKKIRDKISGPESPRTRASALDPLSHVGYTELKITSDSESEIQMSDDEDGCSVTRGKNDSRSEDNVRHGKGIMQKLETDLPSQSSESKPYYLDRPRQLAASSGKTVSFQASDDFVGHGLAELDWESLSPKTGASVLPEFISSYNVAQASNPLEDHHTSRESLTSNVFLPRISDLSALSELISVTKTPSLSSINIHETDLTEGNDEGSNLTEKNNAKAPVHLDESAPPISNQKNQADISVVSNGGRKISDRLGEPSAITDSANAGEGMKSLPQLSTSVTDESQTASLRNHDRLGEAKAISDSANAGEGMKSLPQLSTSVMDESQTASLRNHDRLGEVKAISDSANAGEGMKSLPQLSTSVADESQTASLRNHDMLGEASAISVSVNAGEGMKSLPQLSTSVMDESQIASLRNHDHSDDRQRSDASSSDGVHVVQTSTITGRDDSGNESADGFSVSDIEDESIVDRLKRQIEHDQRYINSLYKELEEERSASAIATNQAMAMITRLQEEKASLHMEALQYLRMMEEQAEYDMEALERANDQLADREKELQDLEEELLEYKNNIPDELTAEDPQKENKNLKEENVINGNHSLEHVENKVSGSSDSKTIRVSKICDKPRQFNDSICNFEDEKQCISKHLENLEKKLFQISGRKASDNVPCNGYSERVKKDADNQVKKQSDDGGSINSQQEEEISSSTRNDFSKSNGSPIDKPAALDVENAIVSEKKNHLDNNHSKLSSLGGEVDGASIGNEISELSGRLQALEDDCKFLMHAFNSLQNGHEGIQLIQEIAHQLQEIRKVDFDKR
ncbi:probable myosin-binding protein 4 isoform X4 [Solanum verrucosum]|uniref:probable myosin-binding protein 4 isoform X4 n=1 Tax=Solanum verrucosum TaxID=315347 RepID=UPI0020D0A9E6|nr:probable myosin-binding protein 4 isoform X4 [Solanum verrucosum]